MAIFFWSPTKCRKVLFLLIGAVSVLVIASAFFEWTTPHQFSWDSIQRNENDQSDKIPLWTSRQENQMKIIEQQAPANYGIHEDALEKGERKSEKPKLSPKTPSPTTQQSSTGRTKKIESYQTSNFQTKSTGYKQALKKEPKMDQESQKIKSNSNGPEKIPFPSPEQKQITEVPRITIGSRSANKSANSIYACTVPRLDHWDKSINHLIDRYPPKICKKIQPDLMFIDGDNYLRLNESELAQINLTASDVECVYMTIERGDEEEDFQAHLGYTKTYVKPVQIEKDIVQVNCIIKSEGKLIYGEVLTYPYLDKERTYARNSEDTLNVIMIFIDSVSLSAMKRHMPKSYKYMTQNMGFDVMAGYNKVADNSFPNLIPMLTGKRVHNQQPDMLDEFHEDVSTTYFDHWPLIWKNFSSKGYVTAFSEEFPDMGLFHLKSFGFRKKPVDHFYINYWKALEWMTYPKSPTKDCYGNRTAAQILLDIIRNHLKKFEDLAQFLYNYLIFPAHDDSAKLDTIDHQYLQFFQEMNEKGSFNRSFVIFLSDHGHRNSPIRTTTIGLLEERLPVCMLYFPPWFHQKYPHVKANLRSNYDRLASNFDIHETLIDILDASFGPESTQRPASSRGMTLLQPIPVNRTCRSAGIPFYFCTCQQMKWRSISTTSLLAKYASADFMFALNEIVQKNSLCARWTFRRLVGAEIMDIPAEEAGVKNTTSAPAAVVDSDVFRTNLQLVRVTVEGEVSYVNGTFQALMLFNKDENKLSLHSDVGRLDRYGNQSFCVGNDANSQMKKLCVCQAFIS